MYAVYVEFYGASGKTEVFEIMQDIEAIMDDGSLASDDREAIKQHIWDLVTYALKRFVLFVSFGPGILGVLWVIGKIFRR